MVGTLTNNSTVQDSADNTDYNNLNIAQINGNVGTFTNNGTIASVNRYQYGSIVEVGTSGVVTNFINNGNIQFVTDGYNFNSFETGAIDNAGYINTLTNAVNGNIIGPRGISNQGRIDYLNNDGVISASTGAMMPGMGNNAAIYNSGTIGTLHNTGSLLSGDSMMPDASGVYNSGTITTLINDNKIESSNSGIHNYGTINTLQNNGRIHGGIGIFDSTSGTTSIASIVNNNEISGEYAGIYMINYNTTSDATSIVTNGVLSGGQYALYIYGDSSIVNGADVTLTNTNMVKGNIESRSPTALKINGGTNAVGVLTGLDGLNTIGTITTSSADIVFGTGSLLLNDNIVTNNSTVVNNAASLQVNNNISITGDYHQKAAATLISGISDLATQNDLLADTGYGRLNVSGNAIIDAGSSVNLLRTGSTYKFAEGQRYVVINALGAETNYNADKLKYKALGYNGQVAGAVYADGTNNALVLIVGEENKDPVVTEPTKPTPTDPTTPTNPTKPTTPTNPTNPTTPTQPTTPSKPTPVEPTQPGKHSWATTPTATAALGGLGNYTGISSPQLLELYNASLAIDGTAEANRVGEKLSPGQNINTSTAAGVATSTAQAVVGAHIDAVRNPQSSGTSGVATGDDYSANWIVWGQPFGGYARQDSTSDISGYSAKFGGLILGADRALGDAWRLGAALNYSNTSVHGKDNLSGNTSTADNYGVIAYAGYTGEPWYLNLSAGLNRQNYSSVRRADFTGFSGAAQGKFNGSSVTLQTEFGYPITLPADVVVTPLASLTYGYQHVDGYTETGGNGMALDVGSTHSESVVSDIGARIEKTFATGLGNLTPFAQVSWIHQYDNRQMSSHATYAADTIGETSFITKGAAPVEDMAGLAIGSTLYDANELNVDARYDLQAGDRYQAHTFSLRLRKMF
jgi:outer membrane autotransporter protein